MNFYVEGIFNRAVIFSSENTIKRDDNYRDVMRDYD